MKLKTISFENNMNNETVILEENYGFKKSFVNLLKDFFGTSKGEAYEEKVDSRVQELNKISDMSYIENLEKGMNPVIESERKGRKRKIQDKNESVVENSIEVKEETNVIKDSGDNELSL